VRLRRWSATAGAEQQRTSRRECLAIGHRIEHFAQLLPRASPNSRCSISSSSEVAIGMHPGACSCAVLRDGRRSISAKLVSTHLKAYLIANSHPDLRSHFTRRSSAWQSSGRSSRQDRKRVVGARDRRAQSHLLRSSHTYGAMQVPTCA